MAADTTYQGGVLQRRQGTTVAVPTGVTLDVESGGSLALAGTAVTATAAEINALDLSAVGAQVKVLKIPITADFDNTANDSGVALPTKCAVMNVFLDVTTADTGETMDVGLFGGDTDGYLDAASINATGLVQGTIVNTVGSNNTYIGAAATHTLGALLMDLNAGEDVAAGGDGSASRKWDLTGGGSNISYHGSNATTTMRGSIYVVYIELA